MHNYVKEKISHPSLCINALISSKNRPYVLFVHGGPGLNSVILEYLIENEKIFELLNYNIILYDQRGCGRSEKSDEKILHQDNVNDLHEIIQLLIKQKYQIAGIIGHSYGAKILYDLYQSYHVEIPGIFLATASSILTPRINNLLFDLVYLKNENPSYYQDVLSEFGDFSYENIWSLTEKLADVFKENKNRPYFYWVNLEWQDKVMNLQKQIGIPMSEDVFTSVRADLYSNKDNYSVDIKNIIKTPTLWINGLHDLVMNGAAFLSQETPEQRLFLKSAHYPHIEESERFCEEANLFFGKSIKDCAT